MLSTPLFRLKEKKNSNLNPAAAGASMFGAVPDHVARSVWYERVADAGLPLAEAVDRIGAAIQSSDSRNEDETVEVLVAVMSRKRQLGNSTDLIRKAYAACLKGEEKRKAHAGDPLSRVRTWVVDGLRDMRLARRRRLDGSTVRRDAARAAASRGVQRKRAPKRRRNGIEQQFLTEGDLQGRIKVLQSVASLLLSKTTAVKRQKLMTAGDYDAAVICCV